MKDIKAGVKKIETGVLMPLLACAASEYTCSDFISAILFICVLNQHVMLPTAQKEYTLRLLSRACAVVRVYISNVYKLSHLRYID